MAPSTRHTAGFDVFRKAIINREWSDHRGGFADSALAMPRHILYVCATFLYPLRRIGMFSCHALDKESNPNVDMH
jgi:hypothetical protein